MEREVKAICWRLDEEQAAVYTEDRDVVRRLLEIERFPTRSESGFSTYTDSRGKVFAWQASFAASLWPRVTRHLRQREVAVEVRS